MVIGFSGTRDGMTNNQREAVERTLLFFYDDFGDNEFHHGDCVGADAQAHDIAAGNGYRTVIHPPRETKYRAYKRGDLILDAKEYLERNKDIANYCDLIVIAPGEYKEQPRGSGTWMVYRYVVTNKVNYVLIYPDGSVKLSIST